MVDIHLAVAVVNEQVAPFQRIRSAVLVVDDECLLCVGRVESNLVHGERMCLVLPPSPYSSNQILYLGTGYVICFARVVTFSVGVRSMHAELA